MTHRRVPAEKGPGGPHLTRTYALQERKKRQRPLEPTESLKKLRRVRDNCGPCNRDGQAAVTKCYH